VHRPCLGQQAPPRNSLDARQRGGVHRPALKTFLIQVSYPSWRRPPDQSFGLSRSLARLPALHPSPPDGLSSPYICFKFYTQCKHYVTYIAFAKSFFRYGRCSVNLNPPYPPFPKGGTERNSSESPPLKKGDLGGFKNLRTAGIYGNGYIYDKFILYIKATMGVEVSFYKIILIL
jgi:hypothetical protein